ncbi:MAG TPA: cell division protein ZapA [Aeromonadales bacterium]|nr:cell division protein ZapA [Aeromonadales bacterium]
MTDNRQTITISILDKDYQISCPAEQAASLQSSAHELDQRMRNIKKEGGIIGVERIAVMAALNTTHELLEQQKNHSRYQDSVNDYVNRLKDRVDTALGDDAQLELPTD